MTAGRNVKSGSRDWNTPQKYVSAVTAALGGAIGLDPCSNDTSIVVSDRSYSLSQGTDGLVLPWDASTIFVNPPYGKDPVENVTLGRHTTIADWLRLCAKAGAANSEVIALVPVATNTRHWKDSVWSRASAIAFLQDTRLKFLVNGTTDNKGAPMACAAIYWGSNVTRFATTFNDHGAVIKI